MKLLKVTEESKNKLFYSYSKSYQNFKRVTFYGDLLKQALKDDVGLKTQNSDPIHKLPLATEQAGVRYD